MELFIGELTALGAALAFGFTSTFFTLAGRKLGALTLLSFSLPISVTLLTIIHTIMIGEVFPLSAGLDRWFFLGVSGIIGFVLSSSLLLRAFQYIGPRLSFLVASCSPIMGAILAWIFLGQELPANAILGIALVLGGILWVVSEGSSDEIKTDASNANYRKGVTLAFIAALGQAVSFVFSSQGVSGEFSAMSASLMRASAGAVTAWLFIIVQGQVRQNIKLVLANPRSMLFVCIAAVSGPVIGASLVLVSLQFTSVGVSSTLANTTPIILIPIGYFVFKERITMRAIIGTIIAIVGVAVLFT